jgi:hypothetical protein
VNNATFASSAVTDASFTGITLLAERNTWKLKERKLRQSLADIKSDGTVRSLHQYFGAAPARWPATKRWTQPATK